MLYYNVGWSYMHILGIAVPWFQEHYQMYYDCISECAIMKHCENETV